VFWFINKLPLSRIFAKSHHLTIPILPVKLPVYLTWLPKWWEAKHLVGIFFFKSFHTNRIYSQLSLLKCLIFFFPLGNSKKGYFTIFVKKRKNNWKILQDGFLSRHRTPVWTFCMKKCFHKIIFPRQNFDDLASFCGEMLCNGLSSQVASFLFFPSISGRETQIIVKRVFSISAPFILSHAAS
jgi:hypothetical protein